MPRIHEQFSLRDNVLTDALFRENRAELYLQYEADHSLSLWLFGLLIDNEL